MHVKGIEPKSSHQDDTTTPNIDFPTSIQRVAHYQLRSRVAWTSAARLHEVAPAHPVRLCLVQAYAFHKFAVRQVQFLLFRQLVVRVERIGKAKIRNDDVSVPIQEKVLQFQVSMHDALFVKIAHARHQLCKQSFRRIVLQVPMIQNIIK